jgi:hypothetical protein
MLIISSEHVPALLTCATGMTGLFAALEASSCVSVHPKVQG